MKKDGFKAFEGFGVSVTATQGKGGFVSILVEQDVAVLKSAENAAQAVRALRMIGLETVASELLVFSFLNKGKTKTAAARGGATR